MKGLSLPINTVVIILIAIFVLVAIILLLVYYSQQGPNYQALYAIGCVKLIKDCSKSPSEITVASGNSVYDLGSICSNLGLDQNACKKSCGCQ